MKSALSSPACAAISDSPVSLLGPPEICEDCRSVARVHRGQCLNCLLRLGVDATEVQETTDRFEAILSEIDVPDTNWRFGNYEILEEIGRGGMGVIYRAREKRSRRVVALKCLLYYHSDSRATLQRFRREAEVAANLDHPNILPVYEVGERHGLPFFTMKYATRGSLHQAAPAIRARPRDCVRLLAKVARAVAYAHERGIFHRDLKPGNILLDSRTEPLVSDFGLAKWIDAGSDLTQSLAIFGTPGFIAPEQALGSRASITPAADIYSLGAILFELLTGRGPFLGENALAVVHAAMAKPAPRLRSFASSADPDLEIVCAKCLERDPRARYSSATALAEDLERWLEDRPIVARRVSPPVALWRAAKRNPFVAVAAVVCLFIAGATVAQEFQKRQLTTAISHQIAAQHSIEVNPFLDLDTGHRDSALTGTFSAALQQEFARSGPGEVQLSNDARLSATRAILIGTRREVNGKARISVQLEEASTGNTVFHTVLNPGEAQAGAAHLARAVAPLLYAQLDKQDLSGVGPDAQDPVFRNPEALNFLQSGRQLLTRRTGVDFERAAIAFRKAISLEPNSSAAHVGLSQAILRAVGFGEKQSSLTEAEQTALRALELNPKNGEARRSLSNLRFFQGRFAEALSELQEALECPGNNLIAASSIALIQKILGRPDNALLWLRIAPNGLKTNEHMRGDVWSDLVDDVRAEAAYRRFAELHPQDPEGWIGLCRLRLLAGNGTEARTICRANAEQYSDYAFSKQMAAQMAFFTRDFSEAERLYRELAQSDPEGGGVLYGAVSYRSALARLRLAANDEAAARAMLSKARENEMTLVAVKHPEALYRLAAIEACLGDKERALAHLREAISAGWIDYRSMAIDPRFDTLQNDERFEEIIAKLTSHISALREQAIAANE